MYNLKFNSRDDSCVRELKFCDIFLRPSSVSLGHLEIIYISTKKFVTPRNQDRDSADD